jgi:hypothetical protein
MTTTVDSVQRILDCARELAERSSWKAAVRLYDIAVTADPNTAATPPS